VFIKIMHGFYIKYTIGYCIEKSGIKLQKFLVFNYIFIEFQLKLLLFFKFNNYS